jgi:hypothetical protein
VRNNLLTYVFRKKLIKSRANTKELTRCFRCILRPRTLFWMLWFDGPGSRVSLIILGPSMCGSDRPTLVSRSSSAWWTSNHDRASDRAFPLESPPRQESFGTFVSWNKCEFSHQLCEDHR